MKIFKHAIPKVTCAYCYVLITCPPLHVDIFLNILYNLRRTGVHYALYVCLPGIDTLVHGGVQPVVCGWAKDIKHLATCAEKCYVRWTAAGKSSSAMMMMTHT